jgi:hypothetical protein
MNDDGDGDCKDLLEDEEKKRRNFTKMNEMARYL